MERITVRPVCSLMIPCTVTIPAFPKSTLIGPFRIKPGIAAHTVPGKIKHRLTGQLQKILQSFKASTLTVVILNIDTISDKIFADDIFIKLYEPFRLSQLLLYYYSEKHEVLINHIPKKASEYLNRS